MNCGLRSCRHCSTFYSRQSAFANAAASADAADDKTADKLRARLRSFHEISACTERLLTMPLRADRVLLGLGENASCRTTARDHGENVRGMKIRDVIRLLTEDGWYLVATKGSHRQYRHSTKPGRVTVAGKQSDDLAAGTLNSVLKQAQLKGER